MIASRWKFLFGAIGGLSLALSAGQAAADGKTRLLAARKQPIGDYLTDSSGMSLYTFSRDRRAVGDSEPVSNCRATCQKIWDLVQTQEPPSVGAGIDKDLAKSFESEGKTAVTFNGWPLYRYIVDRKPGDTEGQGVGGFNGRWRLMSPSGDPVAIR